MYGKGHLRLRREATCLGTWDLLGVSEWQNWNSSSASAPRPGLIPLPHAGSLQTSSNSSAKVSMRCFYQGSLTLQNTTCVSVVNLGVFRQEGKLHCSLGQRQTLCGNPDKTDLSSSHGQWGAGGKQEGSRDTPDVQKAKEDGKQGGD